MAHGVYLANPVTIAVLAFQKGMWVAGIDRERDRRQPIPPQPWPADLDLRIAIMFGIGIIFLVICQRVFQKLQGNFAQEI